MPCRAPLFAVFTLQGINISPPGEVRKIIIFKSAGWKRDMLPIVSMYGIFTYIYHRNPPNVGMIYHTWTLWVSSLEGNLFEPFCFIFFRFCLDGSIIIKAFGQGMTCGNGVTLNQGCVERWVFHVWLPRLRFVLIGRLTNLIKSCWTKKYRFKRQFFLLNM